MTRIWLSLSNVGVAALNQYQFNRKIRLQNQVSFLISILGSFFVVVNLLSARIPLALTEVGAIMMLAICIYLNGKHKFLLSSLLFYTAILLMILLFCFLFSLKRDLEYLWLLFSVLPLLLCERKVVIYLLFGISFILFTTAKIFAYGTQDAVMYLNYSFVFFLTFFSIKYLNDEYEEYRKVIESQNQQLRKLNDDNSQLISIASHDLRSPLTRVQGLISLLSMKGSSGAEELKLLNLMQREVEDQINVISEVLDLNTVGELKEIKSARVDGLAMITNLVTTFQSVVNEKNISIVLECSAGSHHCSANLNYLKKVLDNLISNAVKFSNANTRITIGLWSTPETLHISLSDEGPGMDEEDKKKLFKRFELLSARPTGGERSSGLGLSIVKKYIEAMNGTLHCISEKGKGTTFIITMPRA